MAKVFGDFHIIVLPGVEIEQFEAFIARAVPTVEPWPGIRSYVLKGERGDRVDRLHYLIDMASEEIRLRYFPDGKNNSVEGMQRLGDMADFIAEWETLATFFGRGEWTD